MDEAKKALNEINAGNELTFEVPFDLTIKNKEYKGSIIMRFPSVRDQVLIGLEEAKLRGTIVDFNNKPVLLAIPAESLDNYTSFLVEGIATLRVLAKNITKDLIDKMPSEVIYEIHRGYLRVENGDGAQPDDTDTTNPTTDPGETSGESV